MFYSLASYSQYKVNQGALGGGGGGGFADTTSFLLDQVDDRLETTTNFSAIDGTTNFTISMWIKVDSLSATQRLFRCDDTSGALFLYGFIRTSGQIDVWSQGSGSNWSRTTAVNYITVGSWFHVVMVLDNSAPSRYNKQRIYVNSNQGYTSNYYTPNIGTGANLSIGGDMTGAYSIDGNVNEFAVWGSTALTQAQIDEVYNLGSANDLNTLPTAIPPTNWWRSENANWLGSVFQMTDEMGTGLKLNTRNMAEASRVLDVPPNPWTNTLSTSFDGVDDYISTAQISLLSVNTISFWVKNSTSASGTLFGDVWATSNYAIYWIPSTNNIYFRLGNSHSGYWELQVSSGLLSDGNWHHHCLSRNALILNYYIDGVLQTNVTNNTLNSASGTETTIRNIGSNAATTLPITASLDEISLFNTALSQANVTDIYNSGVPNSLTSLNPLGWWRMGDGSTYPTINDLGSGGNNGTMTNMTSANFVTDVPT